MSDIPADWRGQLDIRAEIARIDRERAETQKLQAEREKLLAERDSRWWLTYAQVLAQTWPEDER